MKYLSRQDIENIAVRVLAAYRKLTTTNNQPLYRIDPEILLTKLLGLKLEYVHLSLDRTILGVTTTSNMTIEIFDSDNSEYTFHLDGSTILVERDLKDNCKQIGRRNFTIAHESSHQILKMLYPEDYDTPKQKNNLYFYKENIGKYVTVLNWHEWQANALASAILLPRDLVEQGMYLFGLLPSIEMTKNVYNQKVYNMFCCLADFLGVSKTALAIRLKQLGLLKH